MFILGAAAPRHDAEAYLVDLAWKEVPTAAGYRIYLSVDNAPASAPLDVGDLDGTNAGEVEFRLHGLPLGPTVHFAVVSYDAIGRESPVSNSLSIDYEHAASFSDSDGDGLTDAEEDRNLNGLADRGETDRHNADTDGDGLTDGDELDLFGTNPRRRDTDGDGVTDGDELSHGTDPLDGGSGVTSICGNGALEVNEECDEGAANSDANLDRCDDDCMLPDVCGDATRDRRITASDASRIMLAATGTIDDCAFSNCDANGDGRITVSDTMSVLIAAAAPDEPLDCSTPVTVRLVDERTFVSIAFTIDYNATGSTFEGEGTSVRCQASDGNEVAAEIANYTSIGKLLVELYFPNGVSGPADLASCRFLSGDMKPLAQDFVVEASIDIHTYGLITPDIEIDV